MTRTIAAIGKTTRHCVTKHLTSYLLRASGIIETSTANARRSIAKASRPAQSLNLKILKVAIVPWLLFFRISRVMAQIIHGLGHALALYLVTLDCYAFCSRNVLEGRSISDLLGYTYKFQQLDSTTPTFSCSLATGWQRRVVASGGVVMNLLSLVVIASYWTPYTLQNTYGFDLISSALDFAVGSFVYNSCLAMLSLPDLLGALGGRATVYACGPAFVIRYLNTAEGPRSQWSNRLQELLEILAREASTRGGQSAGVALLAEKANAQPSIIFDKVVKGKREDIVKVLMQRYGDLLTRAKSEAYAPRKQYEAALLHLRYATGGATHWHNTQPHWYEHYPRMMHHRLEAGRLVSEEREIFNLIAHNGDMDGVSITVNVDGSLLRQFFSQPEVRAFLTCMMPFSSSEGDSDSRSIAEWVDFVYTQGLAFKSLRYAYVTHGLDFNTDIVTGKFDLNSLAEQAKIVDQRVRDFANWATLGQYNSFSSLRTELGPVLYALVEKLFSNALPPSKASAVASAFEFAFFEQDLRWTLRQASANLVGEFALMIGTTIEPRIGVFALTQAFSLGYNATRGEVFGSAEPMGVTTALFRGEPQDEASQYFLSDGQYALIELEPEAGTRPVHVYDREAGSRDRSPDRTDTPENLVWFPVNNNPKITRVNRPYLPEEEVSRDLRDIPYVLKQISRSFEPGGDNYRTTARFTDLLVANMGTTRREPKTFDLVLYGVDFNEDLVREFASELVAILPDLRVQADNSGNILSELKRIKREGYGNYGKRTLFLGVSNSAQTQSTLAAARKATDLVGANRSFVLTQSFFNSMSQAIGQGYLPVDPIIPNTFVNLTHYSADGTCGRRRSEAATVVPVATHAVLTEILLAICRKAIAERGDEPDHARYEVRHDLQQSDLATFREFQSAVYEIEITNRVGYSIDGTPFDSPDTSAIEREAKARAENIIEYVQAYALFATYIVIATLFGVPIVSTLSSPLAGVEFVHSVALLLDAGLFLAAFWLLHLLVRYLRGMPLFERIGSRTEVYVDKRYIARIIERYNATLFSNAPAFLTPAFYWADTVQDALHRFGIRAHRGVITIHRIPDERLGLDEANAAAESNMVLAQLAGIRFNHGQPQSRDKVRMNSKYMASSATERSKRPYQLVLSDHLAGLRKRYDGKLSPAILRLVNRRLLDLADGLVAEFVIGQQRKTIVNRAIWDVLSWIPGAELLQGLALRFGVDLRNITGDADTANQAQIQSTKHPVSPLDTDTVTMQPRLSFAAVDAEAESQPFAILNFVDQGMFIKLNGHALRVLNDPTYGELLLAPDPTQTGGTLVSIPLDDQELRLTGTLEGRDAGECLVIKPDDQAFEIRIPLMDLSEEQRLYLKERLMFEQAPLLTAVA